METSIGYQLLENDGNKSVDFCLYSKYDCKPVHQAYAGRSRTSF